MNSTPQSITHNEAEEVTDLLQPSSTATEVIRRQDIALKMTDLHDALMQQIHNSGEFKKTTSYACRDSKIQFSPPPRADVDTN